MVRSIKLTTKKMTKTSILIIRLLISEIYCKEACFVLVSVLVTISIST